MARFAILDDDSGTSDRLRDLFRDLGHDVACFDNIAAFETNLQDSAGAVDLVIAESTLPDGSSLSLASRLRARGLDVPLIVTAKRASTEDGARALRAGAFDYVPKPLNLTELEVIVARALKLRALAHAVVDERGPVARTRRVVDFIGESRRVSELFDMVHKVADTTSNVLICGESGTGKELVARAIHGAGRRAAGPFVAVNCSAIPLELLESELFGYRRGAFTGAETDRVGLFAEADGGTLFLDEIGDMPTVLQAKLLRVIQNRSIKRLGEAFDRGIDVRIVTATHRDLKRAVERGEFREDLFFRLCVIKISTPALRERREDIPLIATHFLRKFALANRKVVSGFTRDAMDALVNATWMGNVRELENSIERAVTLCASPWIDAADLSLERNVEGERVNKLFTRLPTLKQLERDYIHHVLTSTGGKKEEVAAILGIDRKTLYRKEREYFPPNRN